MRRSSFEYKETDALLQVRSAGLPYMQPARNGPGGVAPIYAFKYLNLPKYFMQSTFETPILLLIFNRPDTTLVVFEQIKKIKPKRLFVAADGPRETVPGEKEKCAATRQIIDFVDWECEINTLFRDKNLGCGLAVSSAITWFFEQVPEGIILEDDCFPDLSFFGYCEELLIKYRNTDRVKLVGGNNFQNGIKRGSGSYYFTHYPEIWGWASWRRTWMEYDFNMEDLEEAFTTGKIKNAFKTTAEKEYWYGKFTKAKVGHINTWDYQLMFSILTNGGLAISPQVNLVANIGIANNPTHLSLHDSNKHLKVHSLEFPLVHPDMVVDREADNYTFTQIYSRSFSRLNRLVRENGIKKFVSYILRNIFAR